jgi:plastocyanin
MRKLILLPAAALPLVAFAANATAGDPPVHAAATKTIVVGDNFFKPKAVTVKKGTTLKFVWGNANNDGTVQEHNVTGVKGNKFTTEDTSKPDKPFKKKFTRTSVVFCTIHPTTMKLTVKVKR